ncbi:hypothetical protein HOD61_02070 [archaeon]|jgi:aspartyl/asparaginyl-tRNA synthetase|nr:hypothetical protein [archaeon]
MNEKQEIRLLLFIITLGIFLLFFMNNLLDFAPQTIGETFHQEIGSEVTTIGEIEKIINNKNLTIITIKDENERIKIILFEELNTISKQDIIVVRGTLISYKGELEIEATEIKKITKV